MLLLFLFFVLTFSQKCFNVQIDWTKIIATSKTTTTLQVVANPLLNPKTSPVANRCWSTLAYLDADLVRYVPWFPYPRVGVAELNPPTTTKTFWDFSEINPQLEKFMDTTLGKGKRVIPNFSTQPTWMYDTGDWSYPSDPNQVDWNYPRGGPTVNTTRLLAEYYGRLLSWLTKGSFVDELGRTHTGGHNYKITHWEVFNEPEGCHGLTVQEYTKQYDAIVKEIRRVADPRNEIQFVGLALEGREEDWISYFIDEDNHDPAALPITWFSFHFYTTSSSRTDPNTYQEFFPAADKLFLETKRIMDIKNQINPDVKIDMDEIGVILPGDGDQKPKDFPNVYWNAAGAYYAYMYANLAKQGYDVVGESQLAGSPPIPEWDIKSTQYPSVSMLNWTNGEGNARLWVLKLLIDHFKPGDLFVDSNVTAPSRDQKICSVLNGKGNITIQCNNGVIEEIKFASFGLPRGSCESGFSHNPKCNAENVTDFVRKHCIGRESCSISSEEFGNPCNETRTRFVIESRCSKIGFSDPDSAGNLIPFTQGIYASKSDNQQKILFINKNPTEVCLKLNEKITGVIFMIDESTGDKPAKKDLFSSNQLTLAPYAVALLLKYPFETE